MAPRLSKDVVASIEILINHDRNIDLKLIAAQFFTTIRSCQRIKQKLAIRNAVGDLRGKPGTPRAITPPMKEFVRCLIERDPSLYQNEIVDYVDMEYGVTLCQSQVSRLLKQLAITRGKLHIVAAQRDELLIRDWRQKRTAWHADQLVFVDESSYNNKLGNRQFGYAPRGCRAEMKKWLYSDRGSHSFLPAYTTKGYLKPMVFDGGSTRELFEDWLEHDLLPAMRPEPGIWEILIMDNASCHRNQRVEDLCTAFGVLLEYLPPYCPIFNPLEASFHDLKAYLRRNYRIGEDGEYPDFQEFFKSAVLTMGSGVEAEKKARGHFKHAEYSFATQI